MRVEEVVVAATVEAAVRRSSPLREVERLAHRTTRTDRVRASSCPGSSSNCAVPSRRDHREDVEDAVHQAPDGDLVGARREVRIVKPLAIASGSSPRGRRSRLVAADGRPDWKRHSGRCGRCVGRPSHSGLPAVRFSRASPPRPTIQMSQSRAKTIRGAGSGECRGHRAHRGGRGRGPARGQRDDEHCDRDRKEQQRLRPAPPRSRSLPLMRNGEHAARSFLRVLGQTARPGHEPKAELTGREMGRRPSDPAACTPNRLNTDGVDPSAGPAYPGPLARCKS